MNYTSKWYFVFSLILVGCHLPTAPGTLQELNTISDSLKIVSNQVEQSVELLTQQANAINIQGRTLTTQELETTSRISAFQQQFASWQEKYEAAQLVIQNTQPDPKNQLNVLKRLQKEVITLQQRIEDFNK